MDRHPSIFAARSQLTDPPRLGGAGPHTPTNGGSTVAGAAWCARASALVLVLLAGAVLAVAPPASAVTTETDANGMFLVGGTRTFPFGLSNPPRRLALTPSGGGALAEVTASGVTIFRVMPLHSGWGAAIGATANDIAYVRLWNQAAAQHGAMSWVSLRDLARAAPGTAGARTLHDVVSAMANDAGLGMWKSFDEPNLHGVSASSLRYAYSTIHALDGAHVSVTIQAPTGSATQLRPYSAVTDVHGVDVFPVRYGVQRPDLHSVGRWTARMRSVTPTGSVVTTLQICSGTSDDPGGSGRFAIPSLGQERYMAYDAIINGARGLLFYGGHNPHCYRAQDRALGWNWTFWSQVLKPLLSEIGPRGRVYPALLAVGTGLGMTTSDPTTQILSRVVGNQIWVIAARWGADTRLVSMRGLPKDIGFGYRLDGKKVTVHDGAFSDTFRHNRAHVYRFIR